jgi:hypothetical protein
MFSRFRKKFRGIPARQLSISDRFALILKVLALILAVFGGRIFFLR